MTENLKIMSISLMSQQKATATAVFNGEQLVIADVQLLGGMFTAWRDKLVETVEDKVAQGYAVIVEERTEYIAKYGTQYLLEDLGDDNRTNLQEALDWYFALDAVGNMVFTDETKRYQIVSGSEGGKIDRKQDDKGRPVYVVDWARCTGGFRAVLLCVVAAMQEPLSDRYLKAMFPDQMREEEELHPAMRFKAALERKDQQRGEELRKAQQQGVKS